VLLCLSGSWLAEELLKPEPAGRVCRSFQALVNHAMVTRTWLQPGEDTDCSAERLSPIRRALPKDLPHLLGLCFASIYEMRSGDAMASVCRRRKF